MYNEVINKPDKCYGCGACVAICPQNCLAVTKDDLGFKKIEVVNPDKCISCGLCTKVCEAVKMNQNENAILKRFYAQHKDKDVLMRSSSGGVFTALAMSVITKGGYIWGVEMTDDGRTHFKCISNADDLKKLCGSKYVEIDEAIPFVEIKKQLMDNKLVMFTGTPCQVQSLNSFLMNKKYSNLLLVDLLCYGVQSPTMWKKYLSEIDSSNTGIKNVQMRFKKPGWENYAIRVEFEDGREYKKSRWKDPYLKSYATSLYNRPVCAQCMAKAFPRVSDVTLGDFWQIDALPKIPKEIKVDLGVSIVLTHSDKGRELLQAAEEQLILNEIPENVFTNMIERFSGYSKMHPNRDKFISDVNKMGFQNAVKDNLDKQTYAWLRFKWLKVKRILKGIK